jgi:hypothetical protein
MQMMPFASFANDAQGCPIPMPNAKADDANCCQLPKQMMPNEANCQSK